MIKVRQKEKKRCRSEMVSDGTKMSHGPPLSMSPPSFSILAFFSSCPRWFFG